MSTASDDRPLVAVRGISQDFGAGRRRTRAVDGVDLRIDRGEVLGLVGESGSGKSTIGAIVAGLIAPPEGTVEFDGQPVVGRRGRRSRELARHIQVVSPNPRSALNPLRTVADSMTEGPRLTLGLRPAAAHERVVAALADVGLDEDVLDRYPDAFSGGQRQRIVIARALAMEPRFLVCDEVVSALDLSVQAHVLNLLADLGRRRSLTYLFISHDLSVVRHISDRIVVVRRGQVVESGTAAQIHDHPRENYTRRLVGSVPGVARGEGNRHD